MVDAPVPGQPSYSRVRLPGLFDAVTLDVSESSQLTFLGFAAER